MRICVSGGVCFCSSGFCRAWSAANLDGCRCITRSPLWTFVPDWSGSECTKTHLATVANFLCRGQVARKFHRESTMFTRNSHDQIEAKVFAPLTCYVSLFKSKECVGYRGDSRHAEDVRDRKIAISAHSGDAFFHVGHVLWQLVYHKWRLP